MERAAPRFTHNYENCKYLGHYEQYDLYIHINEKDKELSAIVARYGNNKNFVTLALNDINRWVKQKQPVMPCFRECVARARSEGLIER